MDSPYNILLNHDCVPTDKSITSSSITINNNNNLSKDGAYDNFNVMLSAASACSMNNMKSAIELELFRRLDGGTATATSSSSSSASMVHQANSFSIIPPFILQQAHYPSSLSHTSPLTQILLCTSPIMPSPATTSPIKRGRDSNTLTDAFKFKQEMEEEDNKEEEEMKGKKVWKKVKSRVKREEEINYIMEQGSCKQLIRRGEEEEEEEERGQIKKEEKEETNRRGGGGGGAGHSKLASSIHTSKSTKNRTSKKEARPPPPPPAPKPDFIHVRARRGQATDSHSLAERVRREKISERMRFLQDLVPGCTKITGKAMMLDEIINYVQSLQHQVEFLAMKVADLHPKQIAINFDDSFMEEEIASALAEVQGTCLDAGIQPMESQCPTYYTQMHDLSTIFNMRFCDDEDVPFISDVSTDNLM